MDRNLKIGAFILILVLFSINVEAKSIRGNLVSSSEGVSVASISVYIVDENNNLIKSTISNNDGSFLIDNIPEEKTQVILKIKSFQFESYDLQLSLTQETTNLGNINLQIVTLAEVTVTENINDCSFLSVQEADTYCQAKFNTPQDALKNLEYFCDFGTCNKRCIVKFPNEEYADCDNPESFSSSGSDTNGCECQTVRNGERINECSLIDRTCVEISIPTPILGGGRVGGTRTGDPGTGAISKYEWPDQGSNNCPEIACPKGYECNFISGKCVAPEKRDEKSCLQAIDYETIQRSNQLIQNPLNEVEFRATIPENLVKYRESNEDSYTLYYNRIIDESEEIVQVYYCQGDSLQTSQVNCPAIAPSAKIDPSIGLEGAAYCGNINFEDLEEIPRLELSLLELPLQIQEESITIELTDNDLINSALCSSLDIDVLSLEVVEPPVPTASVIKQITGFFSKITGKLTSTPLRTYTATIDSSGYSELANLEFPYYTFADNSKARFLDRNVGSALLKDFGYTTQIVETAISSSQPFYRTGNSGLTLLKLGNSYIFPSTNIITDILYGGTLSASRARAIENLGSESNIISALETLFSTRNPNNYQGLKFLLVRTTGNKFLKIDNNIFSVSRGLYLIPYPFNDNINYESISDPTQESDLKPYYDLPFNIPAASYITGPGPEEAVNIKFLTPSEGYYAIRDLPIQPIGGRNPELELETIERSFTYTHKEGGRNIYRAEVNYRIIPIDNLPSGKDYGGFKKGYYFVPEKNIIVMDNEYEASKYLRRKPGTTLESPAPNAKLAYEFGFFDLVRESLRAREREVYRNSLKGWFMAHAVDPVVEPFKEPRLRNAKVFT